VRSEARPAGATPTIPLTRLLAIPDAYEGQRVRVTGHLVLEMEENALYLTRGAAADHQLAEAVWVELEEGALGAHDVRTATGRMATVEGLFTSARRGHLGLFAGELSVSAVVLDPTEIRLSPLDALVGIPGRPGWFLRVRLDAARAALVGCPVEGRESPCDESFLRTLDAPRRDELARLIAEVRFGAPCATPVQLEGPEYAFRGDSWERRGRLPPTPEELEAEARLAGECHAPARLALWLLDAMQVR
jgi:hypothetical protein